MTSIIFATQNAHKAIEVEMLIGGTISIVSLKNSGITEELPENGNTLEANAIEKADYVFNLLQQPCFAEDTGLEVDALNGAPGVYTARYAGIQRNDTDNMQKVLSLLEGQHNRKAQFRTVIAYKPDAKTVKLFEGVVKGRIAHTTIGNKGFGYDPIFIPDNYSETFAQLGNEIKKVISHRAQAIKALSEYLAKQ